MPPGVDAPLSIVDQIIVRGRTPGDIVDGGIFMGEVDGEELQPSVSDVFDVENVVRGSHG